MGKVKRYKSIYTNKRRSSRSPFVTILLLLGAGILIFIGYSIAGPIGDFLSGKLTASGTSALSSAGVSSAISQNAATVSSEGAVSSAAGGSESGTDSSSSGTANIIGIYLPKSYLSDSSSLKSTASSAQSAGVNFAVVDLKAEDGKLNYKSSIKLATKNGLISNNAGDAEEAATTLKNAGITPCARICAFEDPATSSAIRSMAIMYSANHTYRWIDSNNNYWLNPYSDDAQNYIISIAKEAVSMGYEYIMLDGVEFGAGKSQYFGKGFSSREETLRDFVALATKEIDAAGGKVILHVTSSATIGKASELTGQDQDIFGYGADYVDAELTPSSYSGTITLGSDRVKNSSSNPGETVLAIAKYLSGLTGSASFSTTVATIQATGYTSSKINDEITSLGSAGIGNYILSDKNGSYDFSGITLQ